MADDITVRVGLDASAIAAGIKQMAQEAESALAGLQKVQTRTSSGAFGPNAIPSTPANQQIFSNIGQIFGNQKSDITTAYNTGQITRDQRNSLTRDFNAARLPALNAASRTLDPKDISNVQAINAAQKETIAANAKLLTTRQDNTKELQVQAESVEKQVTAVRGLANVSRVQKINENLNPTSSVVDPFSKINANLAALTEDPAGPNSVNYKKYQQLNQSIADSFKPIQGPALPGPSIEEQARTQIAAGQQRLALEKEVNRIQLSENDNLTRTQRLQLQSNVLFGRRNLEGLPPTGGELLAQSAGTIGRYAVAGAGIYAITSGIQSSIKEAENLQVVMGHLQVQLTTLGSGDEFQNLSNSIFKLAKDTGTSVSAVATLTSQFVGAFAGLSGNVTAGAEAATKIAAQLGVIGGIDGGQIFNDLAAGMKAFADEGSSSATVDAIQNIADITTKISQVTGVPIQQLADFLGRIGPIAKTAGLSLQETSALGAALLQGSSAGGASLGQQFGGILTEFSKTSGPAIALLVQQVPQLRAALNPKELADFNSALANSDPSVLFGLAKGFSSLSQAQQNNIIQTLASRREGATLAALLQNSTTLTTAYAQSQNAAGAEQSEFTKRQQQFAQQLAELKTSLTEIGIAIADSGLLAFATGLASDLEQLSSILLKVVGLFGLLPDSMRNAAVSTAILGTAYTLLTARSVATTAANEALAASEAAAAAGAAASAGAVTTATGLLAADGTVLASTTAELAAAETVAGGGLLAGAAGAIAPFLPALGGQIAGGLIAKTKAPGSGIAAGAVRGAGIGTTVGLLGGPLDAITVPAGALVGGAIGGLLGARPSDKTVTPDSNDITKLNQKQFDELTKGYAAAQKVSKQTDNSPTRELSRKLIDTINATYPDLQTIVSKGISSIADIPKAIDNKITDISTSLDDAIAQYKSGDLSLAGLDAVFKQNETALKGLNGSNAAKLLATMKKQDQDINDTAHQQAYDFQKLLKDDTGNSDPQSDISNLQALLTTQTGSAGRLKVTQDIIKAEKALLDQEVADAKSAGDTAKALSLLKNGIAINPADQITLVQAQLDDFGGAFQAYLAEYIQAGLTVPAEMTGKLADIIVAGGDAVAYIKQFLQDQIDGLVAGALGSYLGGGQGQTGEDAAHLAALQHSVDALKSLDPKLGTTDPKTVHGTQAQINDAGKSAASSANDLANARADLMKAYIEQDPVALAQFNLQDSDRLAAQAITEADKVKAMADKVRAEHSLTTAINAAGVSRIALFQAIFQSNGDLVNAAQAGLAQAQLELQNAISTNSGEAAINAAKANVATASRNAEDTALQEGIQNEKFAYDMKQITAGSFVSYLKNLLLLPTLTNKESQDIQLQIKQLTDTLGQNYQFDLPSFLGVPTLYESRRLDQTGGGYQDNRQIVITLNASNAVDGQAAINQIVDVLNGPSRFGTTPRLY